MSLTPTDDKNSMLRQSLDELKHMGTEVLLPRGSRVRDDRVHILLEGSCSLCLVPPGGEPATLIIFEPGMLLNFVPCLMKTGHLHAGTKSRRVRRDNFVIRARVDSRCLAIEPETFLRHLRQSLPLNALLVNALLENLVNMFSLASYTSTLPAVRRVCRLLQETPGAGSGENGTVPMTYAEIGSHLGLHAISVARVFRRLKQAGIVERLGARMRVVDRDALRAVAEGRRALPSRRAATGRASAP